MPCGALYLFLLSVTVEPVCDLPQALEPVGGLAAAGQLVIFAAKAHEPALHPVLDERCEHLVALVDRAAVVLEGVDEERGRFDPVSVTQGAVEP